MFTSFLPDDGEYVLQSEGFAWCERKKFHPKLLTPYPPHLRHLHFDGRLVGAWEDQHVEIIAVLDRCHAVDGAHP